MSKGQQLYELWQRSCSSRDLDPWSDLPIYMQEDWETFAMNLSLDHGLQLD